MTTVFDRHAKLYLDFLDWGFRTGYTDRITHRFRALLGDALSDAQVCDVACGEGYLSRYLAKNGAAHVTGIDISTVLIGEARRRADATNLAFRVDDAHRLDSMADASMDVVTSNMALQDIPDHRATFRAARRVMRKDGALVCSLLHPCFQAPCHWPDEPPWLVDDDGRQVAHVIRRYNTEGHWNSGGTGIRGTMGCHHRTVSTYINDLIAARFVLERLEEPVDDGTDRSQEVPGELWIVARAS